MHAGRREHAAHRLFGGGGFGEDPRQVVLQGDPALQLGSAPPRFLLQEERTGAGRRGADQHLVELVQLVGGAGTGFQDAGDGALLEERHRRQGPQPGGRGRRSCEQRLVRRVGGGGCLANARRELHQAIRSVGQVVRQPGSGFSPQGALAKRVECAGVQRGCRLEQRIQQRPGIGRSEHPLHRAHRLLVRQRKPFCGDPLQLRDHAGGCPRLRARQRFQRVAQERQLFRDLRRIRRGRQLQPRGILQQGSEQRRAHVQESRLPPPRPRRLGDGGAPGGEHVVPPRRDGRRQPLEGTRLDPTSHPDPLAGKLGMRSPLSGATSARSLAGGPGER